MDVFDREWEREQLTRFHGVGGLGVVSGRRRHGKSFLLRALAGETGALYHQAIEVERRPALDRFATALAQHRGWPAAPRFDDWEQALRAAFTDDSLVVIDEFPYLLRTSSELLSVVQLLVDEWRAAGTKRRLVLCGSSLSVMSSVLGAASPLHGRATLDLHVSAFDFRQSARFWQAPSHRAAFLIDATLGGAPGYRELMVGDVPADDADFARWLSNGPLNPAHVLFSEDDYLLREEPQLTDRAHYLSVLQAIAHGATTTASLAAALGRDARSLHHSLNGLVRAGFVESTADALRDQRPILRVADPIVRFCRLVTRPAIDRLEQRRWIEVMTDREQAISAGIFGPHFEHLCREWARRFASPSTLGGAPNDIGPAVLSDPSAKASRQLDLVAIAREPGERARIVAIGEAKFTRPIRSVGDLARLDQLRELVIRTRGAAFDTDGMRLLLFSASGFEPALIDAAARRTDVELVDLDRLYTGA